MNKYKTAIIAIFIAVLFVPGVAFVAIPQAEAACSYQGFLSSGGKCAKSYKNVFKSQKRIDQYDNRMEALQAYIDQLIVLLAFFQEFREIQGNGDSNGLNSEIEITTRTVRDIDEDSAKLRGEVDFNDSDTATVWFEYGSSRSNLNEDTSKVELEDSDSRRFDQTITNLDDDIRYYYRAVGEDEDDEKISGAILSFRTSEVTESEEIDPKSTTNEANDVAETSAELNGSVDMNDFRNGRVFFVYGEDQTQVIDVKSNFNKYTAIDEDGENLQKVLRDTDLDTDDSYTYRASGLDEDTEHYFSMCVEYENEDNDDVLTCGETKSFTTDVTEVEVELPTANTDDADDVASTTAELNGSVDMNDFDNGRVFFTYGTDETQTGDIASNYDTFAAIPEDDALSKVSVDSDLDTLGSYAQIVEGLESDTEYFSSICVEFEDADNNDQLVCGDVERFMTSAS